jgi:hypothetical protein
MRRSGSAGCPKNDLAARLRQSRPRACQTNHPAIPPASLPALRSDAKPTPAMNQQLRHPWANRGLAVAAALGLFAGVCAAAGDAGSVPAKPTASAASAASVPISPHALASRRRWEAAAAASAAASAASSGHKLGSPMSSQQVHKHLGAAR